MCQRVIVVLMSAKAVVANHVQLREILTKERGQFVDLQRKFLTFKERWKQ